MAKKIKVWERAIEAVLSTTDGREAFEDELLDAAGQIDDLEHRLAENSLAIAERFRFYAEQVTKRFHATPPTGDSTLIDIASDKVRHAAKIESFFVLLRVTVGKEGARAFHAEMEKLRKELFASEVA